MNFNLKMATILKILNFKKFYETPKFLYCLILCNYPHNYPLNTKVKDYYDQKFFLLSVELSFVLKTAVTLKILDFKKCYKKSKL